MFKQKNADNNYRSRLIIMIIAAVAVVGIIVVTAVALIDSRSGNTRLSAQSFINSIANYEIIEITGDAGSVTSADKCLDSEGKTMAYAITAYGEGFAGRVSVRCFFEPDSKTLIGIQVVDHNESENYGSLTSANYGAEIADSPYVQRFEYAEMPIWFYDGTVPEEDMPAQEGTRIDGLSGATVSSRAVVLAVQSAYTYYVENVL